MVLESTVICFDNSDYQRNGDYPPSRMLVQKDGVNMITMTKIRAHPENCVGLLTMANKVEVLCTLTNEIGHVYSKLHTVEPNGNISLITGIRIAHLVLKHRQSKNHRMRIIVFIGSPLDDIQENVLVGLAKRLKKEKVNVDIVSFGGYEKNSPLLASFIQAINGSDGTGSNLLEIPRHTIFSDALVASPIVRGIEGISAGAPITPASNFEFGFDPNDDPDLEMALRISLEEERRRLQDEQRRNEAAAVENNNATPAVVNDTAAVVNDTALSTDGMVPSTPNITTVPSYSSEQYPDFTNMTEEEQIAFAMQMSMQDDTMGANADENPVDNGASTSTSTAGQNPSDADEAQNKKSDKKSKK